MRRLYSVFYHYFATISPAANSEQVAQNIFLLLCFTLYFVISFFVHLCEATFDRDFGILGVIGLSFGLGFILYWLLLAGDNWKRIVVQYPVGPVRKADVYFLMGLLLLAGLGLVFVPVARV
ncbi:hypothetical protein Q5H92_08460 [Hymenobacter sp. M29]|uniref:Uncharacterized protein n=1 Tax=Hymenobacter mellowenesis TaxID=3063995 RepID=A0ABT9A975_9BACT|nr:hypothetical protein [Hymenobacter sp. M29]MDO7846385.1 hypothetical protein [Hymenobacter sp. M29]